MMMVGLVAFAQGTSIEVLTGVIIIERDYAWMCFPPGPGGNVMCAKVHKSKFCPVKAVHPGVLVCIGNRMADG